MAGSFVLRMSRVNKRDKPAMQFNQVMKFIITGLCFDSFPDHSFAFNLPFWNFMLGKSPCGLQKSRNRDRIRKATKRRRQYQVN